jgi:hypothetical protein
MNTSIFNAIRAKFCAIIAILMLMGMISTSVTAQPLIGDPIWKIEGFQTSWFSGFGNEVRGIAFNKATGNVLVASRSNGLRIERLDPADGSSLGTLNMEGIFGGLLPLNRLAVTEDGQIFAINLILESGNDFKIYYWADESAAPRMLYEGKPTPGDRYGDGIGIFGTGNEVTLMVSGTFNSNVSLFTFDGENLSQEPVVLAVPQNAANGNIVHIPGTTHVWMNGRDTIIRKYDLETGELLASIGSSVVPTSNGDIGYIAFEGREYLLTGVGGVENNNFLLVDITNLENAQVIAQTGNIGGAENNFRVAGVSIDHENYIGYVLATNVAIAAYDLKDALQIPVSLEDHGAQLPTAMELHQNYPNPFNPTTTIRFSLPESAEVSLHVYDVTGRLIAVLAEGFHQAGYHEAAFNAAGLGSGIYVYRLHAGAQTVSRKLSVIK